MVANGNSGLVEIPALEEIVAEYKPKGLIAHEEIIREMSQKIRETPIQIDSEEIKRNLALLTVWPLIEIYKIFQKSIATELGKDERAKVDELRVKYQLIASSEDIKQVIGHMDFENEFRIGFMNPYLIAKNNFLGTVLSVMCGPLEEHVRHTHRSHSKILHDAQMGGTIYLVGNTINQKPQGYANSGALDSSTAAYSFLQRSFVCVDKDSKPLLFMDNIEGGAPYFRRLEHWRGLNENLTEVEYRNRIYEVYMAVAAVMYMAKRLGITTIVPRDFELGELGRFLGMREKAIFSEKQGYLKIGLHSKKPKTGVYTHSLYRRGVRNHSGHQLRHVYFENFPLETPDSMLGAMEYLRGDIRSSNENRRKKAAPKTYEKLNTMMALNDIAQAYLLASESVKEKADVVVKSTLQTLNPLLAS